MRITAPFLLVLLLLLGGCASLPENVNRSTSQALQDTDDTAIAHYLADELASHPGQSGFHLLDDGLDAFAARAALARAAERSLDVQYYLYHADLTGRLLTHELIAAADRGVRVRILLDDMGLGGRDINLLLADAHPNIELRIFNPFTRNRWRTGQFITRMGEVSRRMHNKSFTADNQLTIVGGRNIGNEYFDADPTLAFGDLDVLAAGPVVKKISTAFDAYWASSLAYPITTLTGKQTDQKQRTERAADLQAYVDVQKDSAYLKALGNSALIQSLKNDALHFDWGKAIALYDSPEKLANAVGDASLQLTPQLEPFITATKSEFSILSAYFIPGKEGVEFFRGLRERGVRVRIVTNSLASTDVVIVHSGYKKYRKDLLRMGVELYEMNRPPAKPGEQKKKGSDKKHKTGSSGASLHAKAFVLDRKALFIGSLNLDPRSVDQNTEIGIMFHAPSLAEEVAEAFDNMDKERVFSLHLETIDGSEQIVWEGLEDGQPVRYTTDPHTGFWKRLWVNIMSWLPIESQL